MNHGNGVSRGDHNRNARLSKLRAAVPPWTGLASAAPGPVMPRSRWPANPPGTAGECWASWPRSCAATGPNPSTRPGAGCATSGCAASSSWTSRRLRPAGPRPAGVRVAGRDHHRPATVQVDHLGGRPARGHDPRPRRPRPDPTQAQTVLAGAILRQLHAVTTTGQAWDPDIATHGTRRTPTTLAELAA